MTILRRTQFWLPTIAVPVVLGLHAVKGQWQAVAIGLLFFNLGTMWTRAMLDKESE